MLNGLDLFSGIGGLSVAVSPWVLPRAYCENDPYAQAVLLSRMRDGALPWAPIWDDVRSLSGRMVPKPIDIVYGGFPCQDVSDAGPRVGVEGKRTRLVDQLLRLVEEIHPAFVFLENVPGIRRRGADAVTKRLAELRYDCRWTLVSAEETGAPHRRNRWFLLAANAYSLAIWNGREWNKEGDPETSCESFNDGENWPVADSVCIGRGKRRTWPEVWRRLPNALESIHCRWPKEIPEPAVCGIPNGIPSRVDCLRALGNSVVPIQAREAFKRLMGIT